jgi:hypothetical protein
MELEPETSTLVSIKAITTTSSSIARGWSNDIITTQGWSNNIIIIIGQHNEAGVTTFCGTLTFPRDLPRNHKIP